jgi:hypothetical protein
VWSEAQSASGHEGAVRSAADAGALLAFDGISESFPIGADAARLAYDEGATMVEMIIETYGRQAIAGMAAAWRDGAGDDEALEAGTGVLVDQLYDAYFASFGVPAPTAVEPAPILPSNVDKPPQPDVPAPAGESAAPSASPVQKPADSSGDAAWIPTVVLAGLGVGVVVAILARRRLRAAP